MLIPEDSKNKDSSDRLIAPNNVSFQRGMDKKILYLVVFLIKMSMDKIVFATNNQHKLTEIKQILKGKFEVLSLADIGCFVDIPENEPTIEGNAMAKARYVYENYNLSCFADDTGLEIEALNGAPGVISARYAGEHKNDDDNIKKVLHQLKDTENRNARFKTVIALITNEKKELFKGVINGTIINEKRGKQGFGYDPVFIPGGYNQTFAEMDSEQKNEISHRGMAVRKLCDFLLS